MTASKRIGVAVGILSVLVLVIVLWAAITRESGIVEAVPAMVDLVPEIESEPEPELPVAESTPSIERPVLPVSVAMDAMRDRIDLMNQIADLVEEADAKGESLWGCDLAGLKSGIYTYSLEN